MDGLPDALVGTPWKVCHAHRMTVKYRGDRCPFCPGGVDEDMAKPLERFTRTQGG